MDGDVMAERTVSISTATLNQRVRLTDDGTVQVETASFRIASTSSPGELLVSDGARLSRVFAVTQDDIIWVFHDGNTFELTIERDADFASEASHERKRAAHGESLTSPMPATVVSVQARPGDRVERGDVLIILEAMKMELPVRAPASGVVSAVNCKAGDLVQPGVPLINLQ
jgi:3-methylcrotonyl-CoA carboxylase alpha subunit